MERILNASDMKNGRAAKTTENIAEMHSLCMLTKIKANHSGKA